MRFAAAILFAGLGTFVMADAPAPQPQPKPPTAEQLQAEVAALQKELAVVKRQRDGSTQAAQDCIAHAAAQQ